MKAMLIKSYGENAEFELAEIEKPQVKAGHVLVKIAASSVNTVDTMIRKMGKELPLSPDTPAILGMDFAGTVEAVGEGVSTYSIGDEVYGCAGGLADNFKRSQHGSILRSIAQIAESGGLKPVLDEEHYSLEQAGQAHARLESGQAMGKVVIEN